MRCRLWRSLDFILQAVVNLDRRVGRCSVITDAWLWGDSSFSSWSSGSPVTSLTPPLLCSSLCSRYLCHTSFSSLTVPDKCLPQGICIGCSGSLDHSSPSYPCGLLPPFTSLLECHFPVRPLLISLLNTDLPHRHTSYPLLYFLHKNVEHHLTLFGLFSAFAFLECKLYDGTDFGFVLFPAESPASRTLPYTKCP